MLAASRGVDGLPYVARIEVDAGLPVVPVGDLLGAVVNEHYWGSNDPLDPDWWDDYLGRTVDLVRELAPVNGRKFAVRFGHTPYRRELGKGWLPLAAGPGPPRMG